MGRIRALQVLAIVAAMAVAGCGKPGVESPGEENLREAFAQQLTANRFVRDLQRSGDDLRFSGPGAEGGEAAWRVHIDSAVIESNPDPGKPHKGVVKSSWYSNDQIVRPSGSDSRLPMELTANGLAQECWAFWDDATKRWSWE